MFTEKQKRAQQSKQNDNGEKDIASLTIEQAFAYKQILSFCSNAQKKLKELQTTLQQVKKINEEQLQRGDGGFSSKDFLTKINSSKTVEGKIDQAQQELNAIVADIRQIPSLQKVTGLALGLSGKTEQENDSEDE